MFSIIEALVQGKPLNYVIDRAAIERDVRPLRPSSIVEALASTQEKLEKSNDDKKITQAGPPQQGDTEGQRANC
ncbi:MAG: hypothetical protein AAF151_25845 [Cyanobacteria bacterium J06656_5]